MNQQFTTADWRAVHLHAIADFEQTARECDADDAPYTAQLFRTAAENRRKLLEKLEQAEQENEETK